MALRRCLDCSALFAVGLDVCPQCGSGSHVEEGAVAEVPERPPLSATKPKWVAYAESIGVDSSGSKQAIIDRVETEEAIGEIVQ